MLEASDGKVTPVDYKRGEIPKVAGGLYPPERVQLCAQGLILRENGYVVERGYVYFVASRTRVPVEFDDELVAFTRTQAREFRRVVAEGERPAPLVDSPKCAGCSLSGICLPDELNWLHTEHAEADPSRRVRRLQPARPEALPLYLQKHGLQLGVSGETLQVREKGQVVQEVRFIDVSQVNLLGNIQVSTQGIRELCTRDIPIGWFSGGGWYYGMTVGMGHKNIQLRQAQFRKAASSRGSLKIARAMVTSKILNCRTLLRRNHKDLADERRVELKRYAKQAATAGSVESLLGIEGMAARVYFGEFSGMLKGRALPFEFNTRNRRPPRDPVNAMLSFLYALLAKDCQITLQAVGFDPYLGFYHQPKYGKPALALDLMEEFRPLVCDSTVVWVINNGVVSPNDFIVTTAAATMKPEARKRLIEAYERRMDSLVTHPTFGYRVSYRRLLEVQARLLGRYLQGEIDHVPTFQTR